MVIALISCHLQRDGTYQGGNEDVMWKLNDGCEIKAFRKGDDLLTPVIQTLVKMKDALQSGDQKSITTILEENKKNLDGVINRTTEVGSTNEHCRHI